MQIVEKKLEELIPYEKNPRKNDAAVKYVQESISKFGFKVPIVIDKDNVIVAGHTRYKASKNLGIDVVPCVVADDLTPKQIKAYRLADNKVSEFATWDNDLLMDELFDLKDFEFDMEVFGFEDMENIEVEIPKESKDEADGMIMQEYLKYGDKKIPITEEEIEMLNEAIEKYQKEFGTDYGFVRYLLNEIH